MLHTQEHGAEAGFVHTAHPQASETVVFQHHLLPTNKLGRDRSYFRLSDNDRKIENVTEHREQQERPFPNLNTKDETFSNLFSFHVSNSKAI